MSCFASMGMTNETQFHVLAVDDSLIDRKLIERLLKTSSYQVTTVDSGSKALEFLGLVEEHHKNPSPPSVCSNHHQVVEVNLIITDYCMPGMTGYDLLKKIKESSSLKNIPVVIMSSENVPSRINRCLEEGAEEFFLKPVRLSDVSKLKPHLLKGKASDKPQEQKPPPPPQQQLPLQQQLTPPQQQLPLQQPTPPQQQLPLQQPPPPPQQQLHPQAQQQSQQANNKRKAIEEAALSPERTRSRYSGLTTVI